MGAGRSEGELVEKRRRGVDGNKGADGAPADEASDDSQPTETVTLTQLSAEIFTPRCAFSGGHAGGFPTGNQSLEADKIASQIIGVASSGKPNEIRIVPGDPDNSYLLKKLHAEGVLEKHGGRRWRTEVTGAHASSTVASQ